MATRINGIEGSALFGNPINVSITADSPAGEITFHEVKLYVIARLQNGTDRRYPFARPVNNGDTVLIDISTALEAAFSPYVYTATPPEYYPYVAFTIEAQDEYVLNGESHTTTMATYGTTFHALAGAYSDMERLVTGSSGRMGGAFTRKPSTSPEVVAVGETYIRPAAMTAALVNISHGQQPLQTVITTEGMQTVSGAAVYAVPAGDRDRYQLRFINRLGCMESVSVRCLRSAEMQAESERHVISRHETFGSFSRSVVRKQNDYETWRMTSGPLDEAWQQWYMHELLMAEHAWIAVPVAGGSPVWLPCHLQFDDTVSGINRANASLLEVEFTLQFDVTGSVLSELMI